MISSLTIQIQGRPETRQARQNCSDCIGRKGRRGVVGGGRRKTKYRQCPVWSGLVS